MNSILKKLLKNAGLDILVDILFDQVISKGEGEVAKFLSKRISPARRLEIVKSFRVIADCLEKSDFTGAAKELIAVLKKIKV